eukprot:Nitzschia sp. Nitz4//scaffold2_size372955//182372//184423//NITZ4_000426-RA/size372955-processed-gene-0.507-mRNA-1//-1//CDS//3329546787//7372//frame0
MAKDKKSKDDPLKKQAKKFMWSQAYTEVPALLIGGSAMVVSSYANQAVPSLMGKLIDPLTVKSDKSYHCQNASLAMNMLWVGILGGTASFLRTLMLNRAEENIAARLRKDAFESLLTQHDLEWFQLGHHEEEAEDEEKEEEEEKAESEEEKSKETALSMTPASIALILNNDVENVATTMTKTVSGMLRAMSSCIFATTNMLLLNPSLVGLSLAVAPVVGSVALLTRKYLKKVQAIQREAETEAATFVEERLQNMSMVKMSNREMDEINEFARIQDKLVELGRKSALADGMSMGTMFCLSTSALCGIFHAGGNAIRDNRMTHGQLVSFGTYSFLLALGSAGVVKALGDFSRGVLSGVRLYRLIGPEQKQVLDNEPTEKVKVDYEHVEKLAVEDLQFAYRSDPSKTILRNVSLQLSRGEIVVVTGKNGAGKSTMAMILAGLYKPNAGKIVVDGKSLEPLDFLKQLDRDEQAKIVQVVPQHPVLFNTTIAANVKYSRPCATDEEVKKALTVASCDDFVSKLEDGIDYIVGVNGSRLSGGQRQRIGLARALLADPVFLVLDEPASSMDAHGETAVADAINACRDSNRSLLVISHRMKTVQMADRLIVLKDGAVAEEGTFQTLQAKKGELFSLMPELN